MSASPARRPFFRRKKTCPFSGANAPKIDYKDVKLLSRYISRAWQDRSLAHQAVSALKQRELAQAIKRARFSRPAALRDQVRAARALAAPEQHGEAIPLPPRPRRGWSASGLLGQVP